MKNENRHHQFTTKAPALLVLLAIFSSATVSPQILFNGGGVINLNGGNSSSKSVYLTLNNPPSNPIIVNGAGVNGIMMETAYSITKYNLGTATTAITIPYVSSYNESFPLTLTPTSAGIGNSGTIQFSSVRPANRSTGWDNAGYLPDDVDNVGSWGVTDNSANVIDRFWVIDAKHYSTSPAVDLTFSFISAEADVNGGNNIAVPNLQAQAYDQGQDSWGTYPISGVNTSGASGGIVDGVSLNAGLLGSTYRTFTLVDNSSPLAIDMLSVTDNCVNSAVVINWVTRSETNSSYFLIEKSTNAISFEPIARVKAEGNTSTGKSYSYSDASYTSGTVYYRLSEIDLNGNTSYQKIIDAKCEGGQQTEDLKLYSSEGNVHLSFLAAGNETILLTAYDISGRRIYQNSLGVQQGENNAIFNVPVPAGIYLFQIETTTHSYKQKLFIQ
jgi:hypothetical protein